MDNATLSALRKRSYEYLYAHQENCNATFHIGKYHQWRLFPEEGLLRVGNKNKATLLIEYEVAGYFIIAENQWKWGWADSFLPSLLRTEMASVRHYGEVKGLSFLATPLISCDAAKCWELVAFAAYHLQAKGAHEIPSDDGLTKTFVLFKDINWID